MTTKIRIRNASYGEYYLHGKMKIERRLPTVQEALFLPVEVLDSLYKMPEPFPIETLYNNGKECIPLHPISRLLDEHNQLN